MRSAARSRACARDRATPPRSIRALARAVGASLAAGGLAFACATAPGGSSQGSAARGASAGDFMVVANRPNNLHLVDLGARRVERTCALPGVPAPGIIALSPDNSHAYIVGGGMAEVWGVRLADCAVVFAAKPSEGNERVRMLGAITVSRDGKQLFVYQAPTTLFVDHYEVGDTRIAVYDTSAGTSARPSRVLPAPRQISLMKTGADGTLYLAGPDILAMDPETGKTRVALLSRSLEDPAFGPRDGITVWNIGESSGELVRMYSALRWKPGAPGDAAQAVPVWGYEKVDLASGKASEAVLGPVQNGLFTGMTRPGRPEQFFATFSQLQRFDVPNARLEKSVDLQHSYYAIDFGTDGATLYLTGTFNDIAVYDADTLTKVGTIVLPGGDMGAGSPKIFRRSSR